MRVAIINMIRPQAHSSDGITEYAWQLYDRLKDKVVIDLYYALDNLKRQDIKGLIYANTLFKSAIYEIAKQNYDVIHITHPELGFVAKILKENDYQGKIVISVHDFMRFSDMYHTGMLQKAYNKVVQKNMVDGINYSDFVIFTSSQIRDQAFAMKKFDAQHLKQSEITLLGTDYRFLNTKIPAKKKMGITKIGYVGSLTSYKNVKFILDTAKFLDKKKFVFDIRGNGPQKEFLISYAGRHGLTNVQFNQIDEKNFVALYDSFDMFMWPSYGDSSSFPIESSTSRGLPVIVSRRNIFDEEIKRRVYEAKDPKDAAAIIKSLVKNGFPKKRRDAQIKYSKTIAWEKTAAKTLDVYKKLVK